MVVFTSVWPSRLRRPPDGKAGEVGAIGAVTVGLVVLPRGEIPRDKKNKK